MPSTPLRLTFSFEAFRLSGVPVCRKAGKPGFCLSKNTAILVTCISLSNLKVASGAAKTPHYYLLSIPNTTPSGRKVTNGRIFGILSVALILNW